MSDLSTIEALKNKIDSLFYENTTGDISGADGNEVLNDIADTISNFIRLRKGDGDGSIVQTGSENSAEGSFSFARGEKNQANADYSEATGIESVAWIKHSKVHSSGKFYTVGDKQHITAMLYGYTEDVTPLNLTIDGSIEGIEIPEDCQIVFKLRLSGVQNGGELGEVGESLVFWAEGAIKNVSGTVSLIGEGAFSEMLIPDGLNQASVRIFADNTIESTPLQIEVTGQENRSILWLACIEMNLVGFRNFSLNA